MSIRPFLLFAIPCAMAVLPVACSGAPTLGGDLLGAGGSASGTSTGGSGAPSTASASGGIDVEGGAADGPTGDGCGSVVLQTQVTPGNVVVVFDQSNSMNQKFTEPDGGKAAAKWEVAQQALADAVKPIESLVNLGAIFFPTTATGNTCSLVAPISVAPQIAISPAATFLTAWDAHFALPGFVTILGTPLQTALNLADQALPDPSPLKGARAVVVITDGAPTCQSAVPGLIAPVTAMASRGIKTFVVGLPGSASGQMVLDAIAQAGGTSSYLSPADPTALEAALAMIASGVVDQCTVALSPPPADPTQVHLVVTDAADPKGVEIPMSMNGSDGWTLAPDASSATLVGAVCQKLKDGAYSTVQFVYGCVSSTPK